MVKTKNCILCFKPATRWTGHVHYKGDKIIAGWCGTYETDKKVLRHKVRKWRKIAIFEGLGFVGFVLILLL